MGAVLVCFGDQDAGDFDLVMQRRGRTISEDSLLDRLQSSWSCGHLEAEQDEDEDEDPVNWDSFLLQSNRASASSGSRLLSAFYTQLLIEDDDAAFFFDIRGKRIKGPYLDRVEILDDYFLPSGRRRTLSGTPPAESLEIYSSSDFELDVYSTSSTLMSEMDYWASSEPLFAEERLFDARLLPPRPAFGRCSSQCSPADPGLKIHRALSSPYQLDTGIAPWSSPHSKLMSQKFPSPKPYLPSGSSALAALTAS